MPALIKILPTAVGLLALGLALCAPARAWGPDGHRIVCAIAWEDLSPAARSHAALILAVQDREAFAESCPWADTYTARHPESAAWHVIALPRDAAAVDMRRDCKHGACVLGRIAAEADALRHHKA